MSRKKDYIKAVLDSYETKEAIKKIKVRREVGNIRMLRLKKGETKPGVQGKRKNDGLTELVEAFQAVGQSGLKT